MFMIRTIRTNSLLACALWVTTLTFGCIRIADAANEFSQDEQSVGRMMFQFYDPERLNWQQNGPRPVAIAVWYPAVPGSREEPWKIGVGPFTIFLAGESATDAEILPGKKPLIIISHGAGGAPAQVAWLAIPLARQGFIVAAPAHHGFTAAEAEPTPHGAALWWERALDMSVALDALLSEPRIRSHIDPNRVAAAGFSIGGYTSLAVAGARMSLKRLDSYCEENAEDPACVMPPEFPYNRDIFRELAQSDPSFKASLSRHTESYRDGRFRAAYVISPAMGPGLTPESLTAINIPIKLVAGDADSVTPPENNALAISSLIPGADLSIFAGVGHWSFLSECSWLGRIRVPICKDQPGVDRSQVHKFVSADAWQFFEDSFGDVKHTEASLSEPAPK